MKVEARHIKAATVNVCGITMDQLLGPSRKKPLVRYRQIAYRLCKEMTGDSHMVIGCEFGNRDHATIIHGIRAIDYHVAKNDDFKRIADEIRQEAHRITGRDAGGTFTDGRTIVFKTTRKETT